MNRIHGRFYPVTNAVNARPLICPSPKKSFFFNEPLERIAQMNSSVWVGRFVLLARDHGGTEACIE